MILKRSSNHNDNGQEERLRRAPIATPPPATTPAPKLDRQGPAVERGGLRRPDARRGGGAGTVPIPHKRIARGNAEYPLLV